MVSTMPNRLIPAEILTNSHYIFGQVKVIQSGLMGMLTDTTTSFLEINDASMAQIHKPSNVVNYAPLLYMVRSQVAAVCLNKREYMGLQGVMKGGFQRLFPYPVHISTRMYDLFGTLEWSGRFEFSALITEGTSSFITLYDAALTAPLFPALRIESPVISVNRSFLETLVMVKKTPAATSGASEG
jgi:hypothetical protein